MKNDIQGTFVDVVERGERTSLSESALLSPQVHNFQSCRVYDGCNHIGQKNGGHRFTHQLPARLPAGVTCAETKLKFRANSPQAILVVFGSIEFANAAGCDVLRLSVVADNHPLDLEVRIPTRGLEGTAVGSHRFAERPREHLHNRRIVDTALVDQPSHHLFGFMHVLRERGQISQKASSSIFIVRNAWDRLWEQVPIEPGE